MGQSWFVCVELHNVPGGARRLPFQGHEAVSPSQAVLTAARGRGYRTAVAAADRQFYGDVYDDLVDEWLTTDTSAAAAVEEVVRSLQGSVVVVTSEVDSFVGVAARVARALSLRGADPDGPGIGRDKARARRALAAAGVPDIKWATVPADEVLLSSPIGYPCIVKPVDGAGSWDVELIATDDEARDLASRHMSRAYGRNVRPRRRLLFEEYLEGPLFSAEGFVGPDGIHILGYSDRVLSAPPYFAELAVRFSAAPPCASADDFVHSCLRALGYDFGAFHLEFIVTPSGPRMVELNARLLGAQQIIGLLGGVHPADFLVSYAVGDVPSLPAYAGAVTELRVAAPSSGFLAGFEGLEAATRSPGCVSAGLWVASGEYVTEELQSNSQCVGYVRAVGEDREDSYRAASAAAKHLILQIVEDRAAVGA